MGPKKQTDFNRRLKAFMDEARMSQADLARTGIISKSYLSEILAGVHPPPDVAIIKGISKVLKLNVQDENELILLAGKEFEHILENEAVADFLRKTVENGWDADDWDRHNQLVDLTISKKDKGGK